MRDLQKRFPDTLVIVGVHSPKFATEADPQHVREAVMREGIDHPVVNDARLSMWNALGVEAWPTVVLIDGDGYIVSAVAGENVEATMLPVLQSIQAAEKLDRRPLKLTLETAKPSLLSFPSKLLVTNDRLIIADSGHNRIILATPAGKVESIIGSGKAGRDDGEWSKASFRNPQGLALQGDTLYVADTENHEIRAIDLKTHKVTTVAGTGRQGEPLSSPWDVIWLHNSIYIAMAGDHRIWRYTPSKQKAEVFAGSGREARRDGAFLSSAFAQPSGLATDGRLLYVADSESSCIREIDPDHGTVRTLAGGDLFDFGHKDGPGAKARFQHPLGIAYDQGRLYIADTYNNDLRQLDLKTLTVSTLAGTEHAGRQDGPKASFFEPSGVAVRNGTVWIADTANALIRRFDGHQTVTVKISP